MSVVGTTLRPRYFLQTHSIERKLLGIGIVIIGLLTLSGVSSASLTGRASIGMSFHRSRFHVGGLWRGDCANLRLDPVLATPLWGIGLAAYAPFYLATEGIDRLSDADGSLLAIEVGVQGVLAVRAPSIPMRGAVQYLVLHEPPSFQLGTWSATLMAGRCSATFLPSPKHRLTLAVVGLLTTVMRLQQEFPTATFRSEIMSSKSIKIQGRNIPSLSRRRKAG